MKRITSKLVASSASAVIAFVALSGTAQAQDSQFQTFFAKTVCGPDAGPVAYIDRCKATVDINGVPADISSASESSLNPSQVAAAASNSLRSAEALAMQTEQRLEALRADDNGQPGADTGTIAGFGPWSIFASIEGEWFDQTRSASPLELERGFDGHRYRGTFGTDYRLGAATHVGLSLSYEKYAQTFDSEASGALNDAGQFQSVATAFVAPLDPSKRKAKTWTVSAYLSTALSDSAWLDASAGYGWSSNDLRRTATFQANRTDKPQVPVKAFASPNGEQYFLSAGVGFDSTQGALRIGPYARLRYVHSRIDGYTETETTISFLTFEVPDQSTKSFVGILGARASYAISASWGVVVPQARVEFEHEFADDAHVTDLRFALQPDGNGSVLHIFSDSPDRNYFNLGAGLLFVLPGGVMPFIDYEALVGYSNYARHRVTGGLRIEF